MLTPVVTQMQAETLTLVVTPMLLIMQTQAVMPTLVQTRVVTRPTRTRVVTRPTPTRVAIT